MPYSILEDENEKAREIMARWDKFRLTQQTETLLRAAQHTDDTPQDQLLRPSDPCV